MRNGEEMMLLMAQGTDAQHEMMQESINRWWLPAVQLFGPDSRPDDELLRWHIKSERNEVLRDRFVQKFVPQLLAGGFEIPDPALAKDSVTGKWQIGEIDWEPLKQTMRNGGPDSERRIGDARNAWSSAAWVRAALTASGQTS